MPSKSFFILTILEGCTVHRQFDNKIDKWMQIGWVDSLNLGWEYIKLQTHFQNYLMYEALKTAIAQNVQILVIWFVQIKNDE